MVIFLNSARRPTCLMSVILLERANWWADIITFEIIALFKNPGEINLSYYKLIFDQPSDYLDTATQLCILNNLVISVFQTQGIEIPKQTNKGILFAVKSRRLVCFERSNFRPDKFRGWSCNCYFFSQIRWNLTIALHSKLRYWWKPYFRGYLK